MNSKEYVEFITDARIKLMVKFEEAGVPAEPVYSSAIRKWVASEQVVAVFRHPFDEGVSYLENFKHPYINITTVLMY